MGSSHSNTFVNERTNDYELAIRLSKDLEHLLETHFNGTGRGLHEKITTANRHHHFRKELERRMRKLATIRNKLIHDTNFHAIPEKAEFIRNYKECVEELKAKLVATQQGQKKQGSCVVM